MKRHVLIVLNSITLPTCEHPTSDPALEPSNVLFDFEPGDLIYYYPIGLRVSGRNCNIHFIDSSTMVPLVPTLSVCPVIRILRCSVSFMNANTTRNDGKMFFFVESEEDVPKYRGEFLGLKLDIV